MKVARNVTTNSHRCQSNYRVNVATIVHVALASLCSYCCNMNNILLQTLRSFCASSAVFSSLTRTTNRSEDGWDIGIVNGGRPEEKDCM